jgi:hypothetical protein
MKEGRKDMKGMKEGYEGYERREDMKDLKEGYEGRI